MMPVARLLVPSLLMVAFATTSIAQDARNIGTAVEIKNQVTAAEQNKASRRLARRDPVRELEVLETARDANGEFVLNDNTKLALGPNARLALDKFVYDPNKGAGGKVTINFAKGAFRFITGNSSKEAYEIKTPTVSLGVRGTVIDGYVVDPNAPGPVRSRMVTLLHQGAFDACLTDQSGPPARRCSAQEKRRWLLYVTDQGTFIPRSKWDPELMPGVSIETAFPFLGRQLEIDPVIRLRYADLLTQPRSLQKAELPPLPSPGSPPPPPGPPVLPLALAGAMVVLPFVLFELNSDKSNGPTSP